MAEIFPELVVYDEDGKPFTVKYHLLSPMLLNELRKQHERLSAVEERLELLESQALVRPGADSRAETGPTTANVVLDLIWSQ